MKFKKLKEYWWILLLLLVAVLIGVIYYGGSLGWFNGGSVTTNNVYNNDVVNPAVNNNVASIPVDDVPASNSDVPFFAWVGDLFVPTPNIDVPIIVMPLSTCEDSDSMSAINSYFVAGYVLADGTGTNDICVSSTILKEYSCSGSNSLVETSVDCSTYGKVCDYLNGRGYCKTPIVCSDTDEGDFKYVKGTCTDEEGSHTDYFGRTGNLVEYYCRMNVCTYKTYTCQESGIGACIMT